MSLASRLKEARVAAQMSQGDLAKAVNTTQASISEWESGKKQPRPATLRLIAKALKTTPQLLEYGGAPSPDVVSIPIVGTVQAGAWLETDDTYQDTFGRVVMPRDDRFSGVSMHALKVAGDSMNEVFKPGSIVIYAPYEELAMEPVDGDYVVVERKDAMNRIECTAKQYRDGQLWPRSSNPKHRKPLPTNGEGIVEVKIIGRILRNIMDF